MSKTFKSVFVANGQLEAEIIKIYLESFGIKAFVTQESAGSTLGLTLGPLGRAEVIVSNEEEEEALELINSMNETPDAT